MKKILLLFSVALISIQTLSAQTIKGLFDKVTKAKTSTQGSGLSNDDIINGLKEALRVGTDSSSKKLSKLDGFFGDAAIKILMPDEAKKVEANLRSLGMGNMVDKAILSMNRAAEDAASGVGNIFWTAIKGMSITDGLKILRGGDFVASTFIKDCSITGLNFSVSSLVVTDFK